MSYAMYADAPPDWILACISSAPYKHTGAMALLMMGSAMSFTCVRIAFSKHWLTSSKSGELNICSARTVRISPIISVWSQRMIISVTPGADRYSLQIASGRKRYPTLQTAVQGFGRG